MLVEERYSPAPSRDAIVAKQESQMCLAERNERETSNNLNIARTFQNPNGYLELSRENDTNHHTLEEQSTVSDVTSQQINVSLGETNQHETSNSVSANDTTTTNQNSNDYLEICKQNDYLEVCAENETDAYEYRSVSHQKEQ